MGFLDFLEDVKKEVTGPGLYKNYLKNKNAVKLGVKASTRNTAKQITGQNKAPSKKSSTASKRRVIQSDGPPKQWHEQMAQREAIAQASQLEEESDPLQGLLDQLQQPYSGTRPGFDNSGAMAALDAALGNQLSGIQGIRDSTKTNYNESDANLQSMHSAFQNDINTNGAKNFNNISNDLVGAITKNRDADVGQLNNMEADSQAKRTAMLKSLGIEEAGAAPESTVMKDAAANLVSRSATDNTYAEGQRANNLSYNTGLAQSVGAEGNQRRAALQQQLLKANSTIDAQEMDVRAQYQNQKAQLAQQAAGQQNDTAQFEYGMYRDEQDGLRGMLDSLMQGSGQEESKPVTTKGYAGLAQDLTNSGVDPETASTAMRNHAEIIASEDYLKARQKGQDPTSWVIGQMTKRGVPVSVAMQLVTNYNNLGSTSGYSAME